MFTGLITEVAVVTAVTPFAGGLHWTIRAPKSTIELKAGDSVCVSGACQTAETVSVDSFTGTSIQETLRATNFGSWAVGTRVNLELSLRPADRIGGHFVTGHVDTTGKVTDVRRTREGHWVDVEFDARYDRWLLPKGSIAIDGVSLTVMGKESGLLTVSFIPETLARTTLGSLAVGDWVNLECDMLVKAVVPELQDSTAPAWW